MSHGLCYGVRTLVNLSIIIINLIFSGKFKTGTFLRDKNALRELIWLNLKTNLKLTISTFSSGWTFSQNKSHHNCKNPCK